MIRSKGEAGTGNVVEAVRHMRQITGAIRRLGTLPLVHQPGERWMYNTGSDVLGVLIARASGQSFETFLRDRIFEPLGMNDTGFSVPAGKRERFATSYWTNSETDALELNVYHPSADPRLAGTRIEESTLDLVRQVHQTPG